MATEDNTRPQSAVLPYRWQKGRLEVLLITSLDTGRWVLPKGNLEPGMSARDSAEKEAYEEAGIRGSVGKESIGTFTYLKTEKKGGGMRRVETFPMEVTEILEDWPEKNVRKREWMPVQKAAEAVLEKKLKKLLGLFAESMAPSGKAQ
jgi:8-oxo-dGTP pyrophosphatase MutT (NUDIX family)